jgi:hypothetical protein
MKSKLLVVGALTVASIGAGVAIAGVPASSDVDPDLTLPTTDVETPPASTSTEQPTSTESIRDNEEAASGTAVITEAPATTSVPTTTLAVTITVPELTDRADLQVIVANGAAIQGAASETADTLLEVGYSDVIVADGSDIAVLSVVYIAPSLDAEGRRLAIDLGIDPSLVRPIDAAPAIDPLSDPQILVYLGVDVENR